MSKEAPTTSSLSTTTSPEMQPKNTEEVIDGEGVITGAENGKFALPLHAEDPSSLVNLAKESNQWSSAPDHDLSASDGDDVESISEKKKRCKDNDNDDSPEMAWPTSGLLPGETDDGPIGEDHLWHVIDERRRREARMIPLGEVISVYWPYDFWYYSGVIESYNCEDNKHHIRYDDSDDGERWCFGRPNAHDLGVEPEEEEDDNGDNEHDDSEEPDSSA